jgi:hypothetical protein
MASGKPGAVQERQLASLALILLGFLAELSH